MSLLTDRLCKLAPLSKGEVRALQTLEARPRSVDKGTDLVFPGIEKSRPFVIIEGFVIEYRLDPVGHRQIFDLLLPGDIANIRSVVLHRTDEYISTISDAVVSPFSVETLHEVLAGHPGLGATLIWISAVRRSLLAERLVDVGLRNAYQRIGHLLLELLTRMEWSGLSSNDTLVVPLNLPVLGDMLALSAEHVSRTLGRLRKDGLIATRNSHISILDRPRLASASGFDRSYLHPEGISRDLRERYR